MVDCIAANEKIVDYLFSKALKNLRIKLIAGYVKINEKR
ncbi:hypothetical protein UNSW2_1866 [Campylobacter concisus UNSW2]|uniref:Uncharacterized protein n=1 Tax=Campylobacter concisus UNSW2 TaxID=1242965 RepID=U2GUK8_9BACT|nr:hypothetical protein UNSW2_1866 [Campylobacter concisus UNSW2]